MASEDLENSMYVLCTNIMVLFWPFWRLTDVLTSVIIWKNNYVKILRKHTALRDVNND